MSDFQIEMYMGVFLDELSEQLLLLDKRLLELEESGSNPETMQTIFRIAHTLKGSSAAMGFDKLKAVMHNLENIFDHLRNDRIQVSTELMNVFFQSVDYIKHQRELFMKGVYEEQSVDQLIVMLERASRAETAWAGELADEQPSKDILSTPVEQYLTSVRIRIESDAVMKVVRAALVLRELQELGTVLSMQPTFTDTTTDEELDGPILFILTSNEECRTIQEKINQISQLSEVVVALMNNDQPARPEKEQYQPPQAAIVHSTPANPGKTAASTVKETAQVSHTVRVDVQRLEHLINLVGELLIDNTRLVDVKKRLQDKYKQDPDVNLLEDITHHLGKIVSNMRDGMMKTRMIPIEQLFSRFPRLIRDLSQTANKEIGLTIEGKETELDRTLIEEISDPLIHIIRNAADHGLESPEGREAAGKPRKGQILMKAAHEENSIVITVKDDGRGIDPERIRKKAVDKGFINEEESLHLTEKEVISLIFHSGMSTAEQVTELSGRGVGMDIVRSHIEKLNGLIDIDTVVGSGTTITLKLPLTLAIIRSLLVRQDQRTIAIPLANIIEIFRYDEQEIQTLHGQEICHVRGEILPLLRLNHLLSPGQSTKQETTKTRQSILMIGMAEKRVCLVVDQLIANQEIVIKSLDEIVGHVPYISGTTILGDGLVALILDVNAIMQKSTSAHLRFGSRERAIKGKHTMKKELVTIRFDAEWYGFHLEHVQEILAIPPITKIAGAEPHVLGIMQIRDELLFVYDLRASMGLSIQPASSYSRVLIVQDGEQSFGIAVDSVTEILTVYEHELDEDIAQQKASLSMIRSIYKKDERLIQVFDRESLFSRLKTVSV
ncbi:chemotaxis protein CheA [Paenibacillus marchantiophytorum]|uniref:Chemotaxis protein CheA n=1 Tax=Paenibacillus marchantiophytorum TaxID=1619310 RepID=A0ABQ1FE98_9BACL|nr:chemotaxis protein CheW [Paenibacillus marchantiophytorum]GGA08926.1 chemotaxis protein CheA [Paenibacillus marchantiophytorum]